MSQTKAQLIDGKSAEIEFTGGSASGPAISFTGDPNTGIYSPGADQVAVATNGTGRLFVDASGQVGVGTSVPQSPLTVGATTDFGAIVKISRTDTNFNSGMLVLGNGNSTDNYVGVWRGDANSVTTGGQYLNLGGYDGIVFAAGASALGAQTERMRIDSSGRVGIGTTSVSETLHLKASAPRIRIEDAEGGYSNIEGDGGSLGIYADNGNTQANSFIRFDIDGTEKSRLTSSGQWLVGTSTARSNIARYGADYTPATQIQTNVTSGWGTGLSLVNYSASGYAPVLTFGLSGSNTAGTNTLVASGDRMGVITFNGNDGTNFEEGARIEAQVDGTPGANDMPGRLVFSTTSDGASSPTERLRITSAGLVGIGTSSPVNVLELAGNNSAGNGIGNVKGILRVNNNITPFGSSPTAGIVFATKYRTSPDIPLDGAAIYGGKENASDANKSFFLAFATRAESGNNGNEAMRIDSSGRLLVGTSTAPSTGSLQYSKLLLAGNTVNNGGSQIALTRGEAFNGLGSGQDLGYVYFGTYDGGNYGVIACFSDGASTATSTPGRLIFSTTANGASSPTERMRITSDGQTKVFSSSDFTFLAYSVKGANATTDRLFAGIHSATGVNDGTLSFQVWTNGNVQNTNNSYGAISDIKLKENIVDANSQWDDLKALQVRNYNFKPETNQQTHPQIGLVAQEVELVSPGLVSESPDRDEDGNDLGTVTKSVNYSVLYMKAVKALQEAMERIETLEGMVAVNNITIDEQQHQLSTLAARLTALESA
jgi:hypothetical protein